MPHARFVLILDDGAKIDVFGAFENILFDLGIVVFKRRYKLLDFLPFGICFAVASRGGRYVLRESACAAQKAQIAMVAPRDDIRFANKIHRAYELHAREIRALELGHHSLHLPAVKHAHKYGFYYVVVMMPERDLVTAEFARLCIQIPAPHARANIARRFFYLKNVVEYLGLKNRDRNTERTRIVLYRLAVRFRISGIHDQKLKLEREFIVLFELLKKLSHGKAVLSARNTHRNLVVRLYQIVRYHRLRKSRKHRLFEFFNEAVLRPTSDRKLGYRNFSVHNTYNIQCRNAFVNVLDKCRQNT